jgi:branched-chain amino acid transport system ATP-binding protein
MIRLQSLSLARGVKSLFENADVTLNPGEHVGLIGANGAGKSTLLRTLAGLSRASTGAIHVNGKSITALPSHKVVGCGIALVPEGRRLLPSLSVEENLLLGAECRRAGPWNLARLYDLFPILKERRRQPATTLSGGQQQMVAVSVGLMGDPRLCIFDEPSLGLAPIVIQQIGETLQKMRALNLTVLLIEQNAMLASHVADRIYIMSAGRVQFHDTPASLMQNPEVIEKFLSA